MRIAIVTSHFPVPSETFVIRQAAAMLDRGHDVHIYADWPGEPAMDVAPRLIDRTTYVEMPRLAGYWEQPVWPLTGATWPPDGQPPVRNARRLLEAVPAFSRALTRSPRLTANVLSESRYGTKARSLSPLYRLAQLARERRPCDVVLAHFGWAAHDFRFVADLWRAPLVAIFHGGGDLDFGPDVDLRDYYVDVFETSAAVTGNSRHTLARLERLGCPPEKLHLLPMGIDLDRIPFRERALAPGDDVRILAVGRLEEMKGHEYAIRAIGLLRERHPDVVLELVGDGDLRESLEALSARLGLEGIVRFRGALPHHKVMRSMDEAHLFVMPSVTPAAADHEGQGLALQEAQACGLPAVATEHGPFPEGVAEGRSAFLVPERDPAALAGGLAELIDHPERWAEMGRAGREHVQRHFDACAIDARLEELLDTLAGGGARRPRSPVLATRR